MIVYLSSEDVSMMNTFQIMNYSPEEQIGTKDRQALDMAISQPKQEVFGIELYPSIADKAAILMINLIKKHPFFNANKRTAIMATDIFLQMNGVDCTFSTEEGIDLVLKIALHDDSEFDSLKIEISKLISKKIS